jgi:hypothetical protein
MQVGIDMLAYQYDAVGNVTQEGEARHFQWNASNQLRQFATWTGAGTAPTLLAYYLYDAGGQRAKKVTQTGVGTYQVTVYAAQGLEYRYEVSNGAATDVQTQLTVLDGRRLYQRRSGRPWNLRPAELYALEDHLGSGVAQTDASGGVVSREGNQLR